jgi:nitrogen regulatory protein PII
MQSVNRIEIIANSLETDKILAALDKAGVPGYTVIRNVTGKSSRGIVSDDFDIAASHLSNVYIICFCPQDKVQLVADKVTPILNKFGGVSYVSEAQEIASLRCVAS